MNGIYFLKFYIIGDQKESRKKSRGKPVDAGTEFGQNSFQPSPKGVRIERIRKKISIIIPALNEAETIGQTLRQFCLSPDVVPHEIIVVDGDAAGGTLSAIQDPKILTALAPPGRARQMNHGAAMASGEILLFLHADTLLPRNALGKVAGAVGEIDTAWGAFGLGIASNRRVFRLMEALVRIRTGITRLPYGDQALFLTRELFNRVGGIPEIPIMEDVALIRLLKRQKAPMRLIPEKVRTSPRRWEAEGLVYCTLRNWLLLTCFMLGARPVTLAKYYKPKQVDKYPEIP